MTVSEGKRVPEFTLPSTKRKSMSLSDYMGEKHVLLVFFPLAFTPG
ncbi:redoxin domain-containing protein [Bacillus luteus]|uniref:Redoxin domain-containing protein n=2 Tax=Alkalicoccus luteus TaxID=1237094 RepID=A0A969PVW9_9BACI|nr:redoxin domain-containing protein [Alkalicoccus luteus]